MCNLNRWQGLIIRSLTRCCTLSALLSSCDCKNVESIRPYAGPESLRAETREAIMCQLIMPILVRNRAQTKKNHEPRESFSRKTFCGEHLLGDEVLFVLHT